MPDFEWRVRFDWTHGSSSTIAVKDRAEALYVATHPWESFVGWMEGTRVAMPLVRAVIEAREVRPWGVNLVVTEDPGWERPNICGRRRDYMVWCSLPPDHDGRCDGSWMHERDEARASATAAAQGSPTTEGDA